MLLIIFSRIGLVSSTRISQNLIAYFSESLAYNFARFNYMLYLCKQVYAHLTF